MVGTTVLSLSCTLFSISLFNILPLKKCKSYHYTIKIIFSFSQKLKKNKFYIYHFKFLLILFLGKALVSICLIVGI